MNNPCTPSGVAPFHVLAKPAGPQCNLDCDYCFYLKKADLFPGKKTFRMSDETLAAFTRQYIDGQPVGTQEVNFAWQGGEPTLMGLDFFKKAVALQQQHRRDGMRISNALQTNGTLLDDEWAKFLHDEKFLVGISVDGPEPIHDNFRKDKGRRGSFKKVMRGLEALRRNKVEFNTLTVVQRHNGGQPDRVYDFLRQSGSTFMQFIPIVEPVGDGKVSTRSVLPEQYGDFLNSIFDRWSAKDVGQVYVQLFELLLAVTMGYPASLCIHSRECGRAVAIEHDGTLYSCDHFVFPDYALGNIADRSLAEMLDSQFQSKFGSDKFNALPEYCRQCKTLQFCYGGCPAHRLVKSPQGEPGLNYLCAGYKRLFKHTEKPLRAMAECLRQGRHASEFKAVLRSRADTGSGPRKTGRNAPCPCGSDRKFKQCCGRS